ncbi:calmodulin-like isoform X1 [Montipora capricornis]|uniref:calmodulin-like isoform X1 n=1 Tax=Montipora capricornis TaxID=246305 RepID=UPI0035F1B20B
MAESKASKLNEEQIEDFKKAFMLFDKDGNGRITADELIDVMTSLGQKPSENEVDAMIRQADQDGDGSIDFMEFLEVMASKMGENTFEDDLRDAFQLFDRDSNGYISKRELTFVMTSLGEHITDTTVENMIKEVDLDGDGRVNYEEFLRLMKK